jgi:hypothetical protein
MIDLHVEVGHCTTQADPNGYFVVDSSGRAISWTENNDMAHLFAAAPDLLAAAKACLDCPSMQPYLRTEPLRALLEAVAKAVLSQ